MLISSQTRAMPHMSCSRHPWIIHENEIIPKSQIEWTYILNNKIIHKLRGEKEKKERKKKNPVVVTLPPPWAAVPRRPPRQRHWQGDDPRRRRAPGGRARAHATAVLGEGEEGEEEGRRR